MHPGRECRICRTQQGPDRDHVLLDQTPSIADVRLPPGRAEMLDRMSLLMSRVRTVMVFVDDPTAAAFWYAPLFGDPPVQTLPTEGTHFAWFETDGIELAFHPTDTELNPGGRSVVAYWSVASVAKARTALLARGATHHRGPIVVDASRSICQLIDPFGTVFGLDGPRDRPALRRSDARSCRAAAVPLMSSGGDSRLLRTRSCSECYLR